MNALFMLGERCCGGGGGVGGGMGSKRSALSFHYEEVSLNLSGFLQFKLFRRFVSPPLPGGK